MNRSSALPWASARTRASKMGRSRPRCRGPPAAAAAPAPARTPPRGSSAARGPGVQRRRVGRVGDEAHVAAVLQQAARVALPVVEVAGRADGGHAADPLVAGAPADGDGPAGTETDDPDAGRVGLVVDVVDRGQHVGEPAGDRELAGGLAAPPEGEGDRRPPHLAGDPFGQLGRCRRPGRRRASSGSRGRSRPPAGGRCCGVRRGRGAPPARCRPSAMRSSSVRPGCRGDGGVAAAAAPLITPVAGLGQRVGAEAEVLLGRHQLVDDRLVGTGVDVVHDLGALVAQPAGVLETNRPLHARKVHRSRQVARKSPRMAARRHCRRRSWRYRYGTGAFGRDTGRCSRH